MNEDVKEFLAETHCPDCGQFYEDCECPGEDEVSEEEEYDDNKYYP